MATVMFSKVLTKTDIEHRMSFPTNSLHYLPSFGIAGGRLGSVSFKAIDCKGRLWSFGCTIRKKVHPRPVLSKGWLAFVAHNELKIGDKVEFYREIANSATGELRYKIEVKKAVKVFGVVFGYAPMQ